MYNKTNLKKVLKAKLKKGVFQYDGKYFLNGHFVIKSDLLMYQCMKELNIFNNELYLKDGEPFKLNYTPSEFYIQFHQDISTLDKMEKTNIIFDIGDKKQVRLYWSEKRKMIIDINYSEIFDADCSFEFYAGSSMLFVVYNDEIIGGIMKIRETEKTFCYIK